MQVLKKLLFFSLFLFFFSVLESSPQIVISKNKFFAFKSERDVFFKAIDELCRNDFFRNDVAEFYEQEKKFFSDLINKIININSGLNNVSDPEVLNFLSEMILQFNQIFTIFMDEWGPRYKELNRILRLYLKKPQDLTFSLILTKYELLREKEYHIGFRLDTIYNLLQLLSVFFCVFRKEAFVQICKRLV